MSRGQSKRAERVAERVRAEIMELLLRGAVKDPDASGVYLTRVEVTADLGQARVYVRTTQSSDEGDRRRAMRALRRAGGHLRRELGPRLQLKYMPELKFTWDEGFDHARRVEELLDEIRREQEGDA